LEIDFDQAMQLELEDLEYPAPAIAAAVKVLRGQIKNSFENSNLFGIQANVSDLTAEQIEENKKAIVAEHGIAEEDAKLSPDRDVCIEMETGTGKTLVYLHTAYELYKEYHLTKFIVLVPSIAIKEGVLQTFDDFEKPLADRYGFSPACFEYDSNKLARLRHFIEDTQPQVMVMTIQAIAADDRIINQPGRDDSFNGLTFLQALGQCSPVIIMDEPQEGEEYANWLKSLAPAFGRLLTPDGSIVIEMGNAWEAKRPVQSLLSLRALIGFAEHPDAGLRLCQEFVCYNRARLPSPAQWVTVNRIRVKDSYTDMEFLSDEFSEKFVPIGFI